MRRRTTALALVLASLLALLLTGCGQDTDGRTQTCTMSITCATILDNMDKLTEGKEVLVPQDGWLLEPTEVHFAPGDSAFDVLLQVCKEKKIHMEFSDTPMYKSAYIEGIGNLYEFDCGKLSGWMYKVNDWFPNFGCSRYALQDGDVLQWIYTCDLGKDVGGYMGTGETSTEEGPVKPVDKE